MKPELKVPSRELSQKLYELGITKGKLTERVWEHLYDDFWRLVRRSDFEIMPSTYIDNSNERIPAPDLSELGQILLELDSYSSGYDGIIKKYFCGFEYKGGDEIADSEPNARAKMLIALKRQENKK